jgi:hypothetical protein
MILNVFHYKNLITILISIYSEQFVLIIVWFRAQFGEKHARVSF